jgi:hypothetical protein
MEVKLLDNVPPVLELEDCYLQFGGKKVGKVVDTFEKEGCLYANIEIIDDILKDLAKGHKNIGVSSSDFGQLD